MSHDTHEASEGEILRLQGLDLEGLRTAWRSVFGKAAPSHLPKPILLRIVAYRLQAEAFGDLSRSTTQLLGEIARSRHQGAVPPAALPRGIRPGTVLVREHDGERHHVMVVRDGFAWRGQTYPSLSKVAHAITGTKWNGPRFFGLRDKQL